MIKKTTIALAVSAAALAPTVSQAVTPYGFVNIGLESTSIDNAGAGNEIFATGVDGSVHANDIANTRFGFKGSNDLGNGLTAGYKLEFGTGTTSGGRGGPVEDAEPIDKRIAQISLSGEFGSVTIGNQWGILYEYLGYNIYRSHGHGGGAWYYMTKNINDDAFGLRVSNAYTYTYGGGGYSSDPFTFSVQLIADPDTATNDELLDATVIGGMVNLGDVSINLLSYSESDGSGAAEPSLTGVGFRWDVSSDFYLGGTFITIDTDTGGDPNAINLLGTYNFGDGLTGQLGFGNGDGDDVIADLDSTIFLQLQKDLGKGTLLYAEYETATLDGGAAGDDETTVLSLAIKQNF